MYVYHVCAWCLWRSEDRQLWATTRVLGIQLGSSVEQPVLLNTEPSLQPFYLDLFYYWITKNSSSFSRKYGESWHPGLCLILKEILSGLPHWASGSGFPVCSLCLCWGETLPALSLFAALYQEMLLDSVGGFFCIYRDNCGILMLCTMIYHINWLCMLSHPCTVCVNYLLASFVLMKWPTRDSYWQPHRSSQLKVLSPLLMVRPRTGLNFWQVSWCPGYSILKDKIIITSVL